MNHKGIQLDKNLGVYGVYTLLILLKALYTIGNYSKQLLEYKFLGNEHWRQLCWYSHKHCEKRLPLNLLFFSHSNLSNRGVFSLHYSLALFLWPIEPKVLQVCYFMHYLEHTKLENWSLTILPNVSGAFLCNDTRTYSAWAFVATISFSDAMYSWNCFYNYISSLNIN